MSALLVRDILRIFDRYEPSKINTWEIVRSINRDDFAAFIHLLDSTCKRKKLNALDPAVLKEPAKKREEVSVALRYTFAETLTMNLTRAEKSLENLPPKRTELRDSEKKYETHDSNGELTVFGLLQMIRDKLNFSDKPERLDSSISAAQGRTFSSLNVEERIVAHNLCTHDYARFLSNLVHHLFPDEMHRDRNQISRLEGEMSVTMRFLLFYESVAAINYRKDGVVGNRNPKTFRYTMRPKNRQLLEPLDAANCHEYILQPYYQGVRVVVNSTLSETRCYNRYGELIQGLLYGERYDCHATFDAVIMPLDEVGNARSWRFDPRPKWNRNSSQEHKTSDRLNMIIVVVDVLRYGDNILWDVPFEKRIKFITKIQGNGIRYALTLDRTTDPHTLEKEYKSRIDPFDPIIGIIYRRKDSLLSDVPSEYLFHSTSYYDFLNNEFISPKRSRGDLSTVGRPFPNTGGFYVDPEIVSEYRTVCVVYAHDDWSYYICKFNRFSFSFEHAGTLSRGTDITRCKLRYRNEKIYVKNAKINPFGVLFLRVYYTHRSEYQSSHPVSHRIFQSNQTDEEESLSIYSIVAYEEKITTSMYDVPFDDSFLTA